MALRACRGSDRAAPSHDRVEVGLLVGVVVEDTHAGPLARRPGRLVGGSRSGGSRSGRSRSARSNAGRRSRGGGGPEPEPFGQTPLVVR
ncbi:hypothetical protein DEJ12_15795 [Curtobacterium sp. MCLR17_059]|nr:hypothetical protein DEJ12_15795 [Curtobacterium sp. MCLR17_059]PZF53252.1 hypothetical protein DEJ10_06455 [Curtobacterium sp. MCLR17_057]